jgi:hypothetical protein
MLGVDLVFYPCAESRLALQRGVEKLDVKLRNLGESRRAVACRLQTIDVNEALRLDGDSS